MKTRESNITSVRIPTTTVYPILFGISISHMLNDTIQSLIPSIYPMLKESFALTFTQVGLITLTFQLSASIFQPFVGRFTDKQPQPFSLAIGMAISLVGLIAISFANSFGAILLSVGLIGTGSAVFHPEASKIAWLASGGKRGLAQSIFQVGGNFGSAIGPLLVLLIVIPHGQIYVLWFLLIAVIGILVLYKIVRWYQRHLALRKAQKIKIIDYPPRLRKKQVKNAIAILLILIFSKYIYMTSISSYLTFYLIEKF